MSDARLGREYRSFESTVLRQSSYVDRSVLEDWLAQPKASSGRSRQNRRGRAGLLPSHGGPVALLDYQKDVVLQTRKNLAGRRSALISLPTGAGKTVTGMYVLFEALSLGYRDIAWLAPQRLLLEQAENELHRCWWSSPQMAELRIGTDSSRTDLVKGLDKAADVGNIVFQTLQGWLRKGRDVLEPEVVVVDECHHIEANEFGRLIDRLADRGTVRIGLSATPGRSSASETAALQRRFGERLLTPDSLGDQPVEVLQKRGVYSTIVHQKLVPTFKSDRERASENIGTIRPLLAAQSAGRLDSLLEFVASLSDGQRTLVFGYSIAHCQVIAAGLSNLGLAVAVVDSDTSAEDNKHVINQFRSGNIRVLVNVRYLATGADLPAADVVVFAVPVGSGTTFEQIVGRVCRGPAVGGTPEALVADFDGHFARYGGLQAYARYSAAWR